MNKIKKVYSLEYTNIPKAFFTPRHLGRCCTSVIPTHYCVLSHSYAYFIQARCCVSYHSCTNVNPKYCCTTMGFNNGVGSCGQKGRYDQPIRCYSITIGRKEHLIKNWRRCRRKRSPNFRYYPNTGLDGLRKTTKILSQDSRSPGR
jgi:hypothetical protein